MQPRMRAPRVGAFVAAAAGLETAGFCETEEALTAFANSAGQGLEGRATSATLDGIARTPSSDGSARLTSCGLAELDGDGLGKRAATKARASADASEIEPGRYEVVLEPACVSNMLTFVALYGFNARAVEEGRSFAQVGEAQFDEAISVRDDAGDPISVGLPFDAEGTPKRRVPLVEAGATAGICQTGAQRGPLAPRAPATRSRAVRLMGRCPSTWSSRRARAASTS